MTNENDAGSGPTYVFNSFLEGGAGHKTAVTPGINEITDKELPLAQPEEQGACRGKVASGNHDEGVDDVVGGITTITSAKDDPEGRRGVNPETAKRRKVNSEVEDDAKSNLRNFS